MFIENINSKTLKCVKDSKLAPTNKEQMSQPDSIYTLENKNLEKTHSNNSIYYLLEDAQKNLQENQFIFGFDYLKSSGDVVKRFINKTYKQIFRFINKEPIKNLYEYWNKDDKLKLFIDLDCKLTNSNQYTFDYITETAIEATNKKLLEYNIKNPTYIILSANTNEKLSAHIIYPEVIFDNIYLMKNFFETIDCDKLKDNKIWDSSVYKPGSLRIYGTAKINKNNKLILDSHKNYKYNDEYKLFLDTLLKHTNNIKPIEYQIKEKNINYIQKKNKIIIDKVNNINKIGECYDIPLEDLQKYLELISIDRSKNYDSWIQVGMTLNNCNSDALNLWIEWSKKCYEYKNTPNSIYQNKWNEFIIHNHGFSFLKAMAKTDNPEKFREINYGIEKDNFESIEFTKEYLLMNNDTKNDVVRDNITKFVTDNNIKTLCIKSPYNTGKSTLLNKLIIKNYKRILVVSYRKTLTNNLLGTFVGFSSYLDKQYKANKLICQVDSLINLLNNYLEEYIDIYPKYDLVILDECESVLNHMNASTLKNSYETFDILRNIIINSNKLICLDGDLSNRTYDFIKGFGNNIIVKNLIKKDIKHFVFRKNKNKFDKLISKDLKKGLNLCIVSMSSKVAESIYTEYKDKYKCCIHTGNSDDTLLEKLKDVNNYWKDFQLIIYSPSIESGVDYNFDNHIDKIYGILSSKSTSQRAFMQMLSRCRKVKNKEINILLNNLPFYENSCYYTFTETRDYVISIYQKHLKRVNIMEDGFMKIKYVYDEYVNNLVYNKQEELNKNSALFVPYLLQLIKNKGHTYEFINDDIIDATEKIKLDDDVIKEIYNSLSVNKKEISKYINNKISGDATRSDKMIIEKYMFKSIWKIDYFECDTTEKDDLTNKKIIDFDFFKKYARQTYVLNNLRTLLDNKEIEIYDNYKDNVLINYDNAEYLTKVDFIKKLLLKLGYKLDDLNILLEKDIFIKNLEIISTSKEFFGSEKNKILFGFNKNTNKTTKSYLGFLNSILKNWGVNIILKQKTQRKDSKIIIVNYYKLCFLDIYIKYL